MDVSIMCLATGDWLPTDYYVFAISLSRQRRTEFSEKRGVNDRDWRPALFEEVGVIAGPQRGAGGHGHGADFHSGEICGRELRNVREDQQHSLIVLQSQIEQTIPETIDLGSDFTVGKPPVSTDDGDHFAAALSDVAI
jgi:hypothetical protein